MTLMLLALSLPFFIAFLLALLIGASFKADRAWAAGTSPLGAAIAVEGLSWAIGNGASPETFTVVANVTDITLPFSAKTVDVTNVSNNWQAEIPTLLQYGKISMKVFWVMEEVTHRNAVTGNVRGLWYIFLNKILADHQFIFPDGNTSTSAFKAYVTEFSVSAKTGGVFEATVTLTGNDQNPSLV